MPTGRMQALFWLNTLYTALTGWVLYSLVLQLGGSRKQAVITTLVFGFGTLAWPYAKTFFREPLAMLLLMLTVYLLVLATGERGSVAVRYSFCYGRFVVLWRRFADKSDAGVSAASTGAADRAAC